MAATVTSSKDLLSDLDAAFAEVEAKRTALDAAAAAQSKAVSAKQAELDALKTQHAKTVSDASAAFQAASARLEAIGEQMRQRIGVTSGRVR